MWVKGCFFCEFIDFLIAGYSSMTWDPDKRDVDIEPTFRSSRVIITGEISSIIRRQIRKCDHSKITSLGRYSDKKEYLQKTSGA